LKTVITIVVSVIVTACGSNGPMPAAPSSSTTSSTSPGVSMGTATISGVVNGGSGASAFRPMAAGSLSVSIAGSPVTTTVDGSGRFTLQNVPSGDQTLVFSGSGVNARLAITGVGDHEMIQVSVNLSGSTADLDEDEREGADHHGELEGRLASINAAAGTFVVRGVTVTVPAGTPVHHGSTAVALSALVVGERVHVKGTMTAATAMTASDVEVQNEQATPGNGNGNGDDDQGGDDHGQVELNGSASGVTGTCPAVTFTLSSTTVTTNASTKFDGVACTALATAGRLEVKGSKQTNGSVLATKVAKDD
jgi:hypothetical protein